IGLGPSLLGVVRDRINLSQLYVIMEIVGIITLFIYFVVHGRNVKHQ
ncbi:MFS transporter, partial [Staphylococcus capitis]